MMRLRWWVSLAFCLIVWNSVRAQTTATSPATGPSFELRVVDAAGQPLAGARVTAQADDQKKQVLNTDDEGRCILALPAAAPRSFSITASMPRHVPMRATWSSYNERKDPIPSAYTLKLPAGTTIGGIIQDEQSQGIPNVKVFLLVPSRDRSARERPAIWDYVVQTDADGRWTCDIMPADLGEGPWIRLAHADYISDSHYSGTPRPTLEQLRAGTGVMVMKKGFAVAGRVIGADGQPIQGASVAQGDDRFGSHFPKTKTDEQGAFLFKNCKPGEMWLTVQAKGHAPDLRVVTVGPQLAPVEFRLEAGRVLRGRVVDREGKPAADVYVVADTWRGQRSLEWRTRTDREGQFEWRDAPADEIFCDVFREGFMDVRHRPMKAGEPISVTLSPPLRLSGSVVDAATGEPVTEFKIVPGTGGNENDKTARWNQREVRAFTDGRYELTFTYPYPAHLLRVEAEGYLPAISRAIKNDEGTITVDFKLEKGKGIEGVVCDPAGKPLAGALVAMGKPPYFLQVENGRIPERVECPRMITGPDGRFSLLPETDKWLLVILHEQGYAEVTAEQLAASERIMLAPWAQVHGVFRIGSKPAGSRQVQLWMSRDYQPQMPTVHYQWQLMSDSEGRFTFDRVPPGKGAVAYYFQTSDRSLTSALSKRFLAEAGKRLEVNLGGTGRPVTGHVVVPAGAKLPEGWVFSMCGLSTKPQQSPFPADWQSMSDEQKKSWSEKWLKSDEGKAFLAAQEKREYYGFAPSADGAFRVEDVVAGTYTLQVTIAPPPTRTTCVSEPIATGSLDVSVPDMPGGRSDEPLDIGEVQLQVIRRLNVGDTVPSFTVKTLDDRELKFEDFKGKVVLLDFWATWCGPCLGETPHLKAVYDSFGQNPKFAMIGLSLDAKAEQPRKYAEKNELKWHQGFLGEWSKVKLPNEFGVQGIPSIWLIGPDGKVIAKDLRGAAIHSAVAAALARPAADERK